MPGEVLGNDIVGPFSLGVAGHQGLCFFVGGADPGVIGILSSERLHEGLMVLLAHQALFSYICTRILELTQNFRS